MKNLTEGIENLYESFSSYKIKPELRERSCDCCVSDDEIQLLLSKPLKELSEDDLRHFMSSAITTFGEVEDYKHFLPRILELMQDVNSTLLDDFLIYEKLDYVNWNSWNKDEVIALEDYFSALWKKMAGGRKVSFDQIEEVFKVAIQYLGLRRAISIWESNASEKSMLYLVNLYNSTSTSIIKKEQREQFEQYISTPIFLEKLEKCFEKEEDEIRASLISVTYTALEKKTNEN